MIPKKYRAWDKRHAALDYFNKEENELLYGIPALIVMNYIGIDDKNGQKIYENDIIRGPNYRGEETLVLVEYIAGQVRGGYFKPFGVHDFAWEGKKVEVVGNSFEDPDLLYQIQDLERG